MFAEKQHDAVPAGARVVDAAAIGVDRYLLEFGHGWLLAPHLAGLGA